MDHELEQLARTHRRLTENGADVEHADTAHFEKVLQHGGATAFERIGRDAIQLDDVVGYQAVAAGDELQRQLALADRRSAGDENAHFQYVEENTVQRSRFGEHA